MGLSFSDFQRTRGKYGYIFANCLTKLGSGGAMQAIVAVDGPPEGYSALATGVVRQRVRQLADDVQRLREIS